MHCNRTLTLQPMMLALLVVVGTSIYTNRSSSVCLSVEVAIMSGLLFMKLGEGPFSHFKLTTLTYLTLFPTTRLTIQAPPTTFISSPCLLIPAHTSNLHSPSLALGKLSNRCDFDLWSRRTITTVQPHLVATQSPVLLSIWLVQELRSQEPARAASKQSNPPDQHVHTSFGAYILVS